MMSKPSQDVAKRRQPTREDKKRVADAFDPVKLAHLCTTWDFTEYATKHLLPPEKGWKAQRDDRFYWYQDNGSDVLAVAHLDTVQDDTACQVTHTAAGLLATSGGLDDRLGVYVILELLPALGITCDVLLTTDEEYGASTARDFARDHDGKDYNWLIEFDRGGTDVVMYQYETREYVALVEDCGARVGDGSYSDIADLDTLGCAAFNWGVGYRDYHSERSHAWLTDTFRMVARFVKFHEANAATHLPHDGWCEDDLDDVDIADRPGALPADCGHLVDVDDSTTYAEGYGPDGFRVLCNGCFAASATLEDAAS